MMQLITNKRRKIEKVTQKVSFSFFKKLIGKIVCKKDIYFIIEYCSDERIYRKTYELISN